MKTERERSKERLLHIADAADKIEKFTRIITEQHFLKDDQMQGAVLFQFSIIGEAIIHVNSDILKKYDYPWHEVRAFRNMISHEYFNIRLEKVWSIIRYNLPELKETVRNILQNEF